MTETDLIMQWTVAAIVGLVLLFRGQLSLFHPTSVYLAFHIIVFCLRPTLVATQDFDTMWNYMQIVPQPDKMRLALLVSSVGLIVFVTAFSLATARAAPLQLGGTRQMDRSDIRAFILTAAIFAPLGIYSIHAARVDGEYVDGVMIMTGTSGYINDLQQVLIPVTLLFIVATRWRWWSYAPFLIYVYYRAEQGWGRWTIILSFFLLVLLWLWDHRRRFPPLIFIAAGAGLMFVFMTLSHNRMAIRNWLAGEAVHSPIADADLTIKERFDGPDFANFDFLTYVVTAVPDKTKTWTYGTQYLQLFTEPIPRRLWKDKPAGAPVKFFNLDDYGNFRGMTVSLVGDGWMSGGWIGLVLTMSIAGGVLGAAYTMFTRHQDIPYKACFYLITNAMIVQFFRDGGISIFKFLFFTFMPLFVWKSLALRMRVTSQVDEEREQLREERQRRRALGQAIVNPDLAPPPANAGDDREQDDEYEDEDRDDDEDGDAYPEDDDEAQDEEPEDEPPPPAAPPPRPPARPQPRWRDDTPR